MFSFRLPQLALIHFGFLVTVLTIRWRSGRLFGNRNVGRLATVAGFLSSFGWNVRLGTLIASS